MQDHRHIKKKTAFCSGVYAQIVWPFAERLLGPIKEALRSFLRDELVERVITHSQMNTDGHERLLLRKIYTEVEKTTDRETAGMFRQAMVSLLGILFGI